MPQTLEGWIAAGYGVASALAVLFTVLARVFPGAMWLGRVANIANVIGLHAGEVAKLFSGKPGGGLGAGGSDGQITPRNLSTTTLQRRSILVGAAGLCAIVVACGPSLPSPLDQARVATYEGALQACNAQLAIDKKAAEADGGTADKVALKAQYDACAHNADVAWGRADGGK